MNQLDDTTIHSTSAGAYSPIIWILMTLLVAFAAAASFFGATLFIQVNALQQQVIASHQQVNQLKLAIANAQHMAESANNLVTEQQKLTPNINQWTVAEAAYLVSMAQDYLLLNNSAQAKTLLLKADEVVGRVTDPNLMTIRQSLANDISKIQAIPEVNVIGIYTQLNILNAQLDTLPLPRQPISQEQSNNTHKPDTATTWWEKTLNKFNQALSKIVIVRYNSGHALPLVMPETKAYLYQNLHAQMESAMWAVLHKNPVVYQASLTRLTQWIRQYYANDAVQTQNMLRNLAALQSVELVPTVTMSLSPTIQLFDDYLRKN